MAPTSADAEKVMQAATGVKQQQKMENSKEAMAGQKGKSDGAIAVVSDTTSTRSDIWSIAGIDPALELKMHLVNNAIDEIGMTPYHYKLFVLNGFGYAVDSLILLIQSVIAIYAINEFQPGWTKGLTVAAYVGMLTGALVLGFSADLIGRKLAFNLSLMLSSVFTIAAGASPNWIVLGTFTSLAAFFAGGNLVLDTAVFLEYLPSRSQWLLTLMAAWWGLGQVITGVVAWGFLPNYSCDAADAPCPKDTNMGWRYVWYTCGALVFAMSIARVTVIRLKETPKYLLGQNRDAEVVETLQWMANKYGRHCSLTTEQLEECGEIKTSKRTGADGKKINFSFSEVWMHIKGLFLTKKLGLSTALIWFSWTLIGLAYPLYNVYLPIYLQSRGRQFGETSQSIYWRNYLFANICGIFGPVLAAFLCEVRFLGRRGAMVIGALITMVFFFCYTQVTNEAGNVGLNCAINFWLNVYYATLYAYTPEVLPSAHRTTGNGIAVAFNRLCGIMSAVIATYADPTTTAPIYVCAGLFVVAAGVAAAFPFEPYGKRSN